MVPLRRVNLVDYPGLDGAEAEFFAICDFGRPLLIHICLLRTKAELQSLKRRLSRREPDEFDMAFCCWTNQKIAELPSELILLAFCEPWCLPNVIYHESFHAGIYARRSTNRTVDEMIDFVQTIQQFGVHVLTRHLKQTLPPNIENRIGHYQDAKSMPGYQGQPGAAKEIMWRPLVRPNLWVQVSLFESSRGIAKSEIANLERCPYFADSHVNMARLSATPAVRVPDILQVHFHRKRFNFEIIMHVGMHAALVAVDGESDEHDEVRVQLYDQFSMIVGGQFREFLQ